MKIRQIDPTDLDSRISFLSHANVSAGITIELPLSQSRTAMWLSSIQKDNSRRDFTFVENSERVGFGGLVSIDNRHGTCELYIFMDPARLGRGLGKAGSRLLLAYAEQELGIRKIFLYATATNYRAVNLYEQLGFEREGLLREHIWHRGGFVDRAIYSMFLKNNSINLPSIYDSLT